MSKGPSAKLNLKPSCAPSFSAAAPVHAGAAGLEAVLMHNVFVSMFLSKGRNFIKPISRITLEWLLLLLLTPSCWHIALRCCIFRSPKPVCAPMGWYWPLVLPSCWLCPLAGSGGGCACWGAGIWQWDQLCETLGLTQPAFHSPAER